MQDISEKVEPTHFNVLLEAIVQKGYVGFYFMCIYMNEPLKKRISPELLKCLKGKACFHIKKDDSVIYVLIEKALKIGFAEWRHRGGL